MSEITVTRAMHVSRMFGRVEVTVALLDTGRLGYERRERAVYHRPDGRRETVPTPKRAGRWACVEAPDILAARLGRKADR